MQLFLFLRSVLTPAAAPFVLLAITLCLKPQLSAAGEANHGALQFASSSECSGALDREFRPAPQAVLDGREISLVSWNIKKGTNSGWRRDLRRLTSDANLVLLQEAVLSDDMVSYRQEDFHYWSFSPGYETATLDSGVMTFSSSAPTLLCSLQHQEPWLNTPKAAGITRYRLAETGQNLLLVNVHQINFTFGLADFRRQLMDLAEVMQQHDGPIILSGDFNTWKQSRSRLLKEITDDLGLDSVTFSPDHRKTFMGNPLDHVFVRGLEVIDSYTEQVNSSDHNPMILKLTLQEA